MQEQLQVLWPVRKSVDGLPAICFRRLWHLLLTYMPKVRVGGFPTFHCGASARTARVTPARLASVIIECCQLSPNHQMEAMRSQNFENILCNHLRCKINFVSITITFDAL